MPSTNGHGPKRVVLYARVSTGEQARSGYSLAQQIEALREYAARGGYEVLEEVRDAGQSGASLERPGMDRVRDLVAAGGVSVVLAQDRDRFAREPAYLFSLREEFAQHQTALTATIRIIDLGRIYGRSCGYEREPTRKTYARKSFRRSSNAAHRSPRPPACSPSASRRSSATPSWLEADRDALLDSLEAQAPEALDSLTPDERHQ